MTNCFSNLPSGEAFIIVSGLKKCKQQSSKHGVRGQHTRAQQSLQVVIQHLHTPLQHSPIHIVECLFARECQLCQILELQHVETTTQFITQEIYNIIHQSTDRIKTICTRAITAMFNGQVIQLIKNKMLLSIQMYQKVC